MAFALLLTHVAGAENLLENGDFEGAYGASGVAEGWKDNSYSSIGSITCAYSRETHNPRSGEACQRMGCTRIGYITRKRTGHPYHGAWQMVAVKNLPLRKGAIYRVRASVRADRPMPVEVILRMRGKPWTKYAIQTVAADRHWQDVDYLFVSHLDDAASAFFLRSEYLGTVWSDDVSVEEITPEQAAEIAGPVTPGNLLQNGNFDLGRVHWMGERGWDGTHDGLFTVDEADGNPCIKLESPVGSRALRSDAVPVTRGQPIRVACRVRSATACEVTLRARYETSGFSMPVYCTVTKQVGPEWDTLEAEGRVPFLAGPAHAFVDFSFPAPGPVWVDEVTLSQEDGQSVPVARAAIASERYPWSRYFDGEPVRLRLMSSVPEGRAPLLSWRIDDYLGSPVRVGSRQREPGRAHESLDVSDLPRGYYHASVHWQSEGRSLRSESTFCILPPPERAGPKEASFFGGHVQISPVNTRIANAVGTRWARLWPPGLTLWRNLEPEQGKWCWRDAEIRQMLDAGLELVGMIESPPKWVKWNSETYWQEWETYAATVVERYRGLVNTWEIQNEPNLQWWWLEKPDSRKRAEWYVEVLKHIYPVIKRVAPEATVYGGSIGGDFSLNTDCLAFTQEIIELGGLEYMDVLSYHIYHTYANRMPMDEAPDPVEDAIARMKDTMRRAGRELPIVNSEGGTFNPAPAITYRPIQPGNYAPIPPAEVARLVVRQHVSQWAAGVEKFMYYNQFINGSPLARAWDSFVEGDGQPRPTVAAYAAMTWLLDGARFLHTERPTADTWLHHFRVERGLLTVAYTRTGTTADHAFPGPVEAWDMMGRALSPTGRPIPLTPDPVYVLVG